MGLGTAQETELDTTPRVLSVATQVPQNRWIQEEILEALAEHFPLYGDRRVRRMFQSSGIEARHLVLDRESFDPVSDADALHALYRRSALDLASAAARKALKSAGLEAAGIDYIVATTCTGYICPGLSSRLAAELRLRDDLQRADLVGMGCAGAMPSLQRTHDFVRAYPGRRALLVTVEISSACWYVDDSLETVVGNTICADGAAAAVVGLGERDDGPALERFSTLLEPAFLESVGLEFKAGKHRIVLSKDLRSAAGPLVKRAVDRLLDESDIAFEAVDHWIVHSGGKRVLDGVDRALGFESDELANSRAILRNYGNMSSPTLLFVMERAMQSARAGDLGVMVALGPGLAAETGLVRW